MVVVPNEEHFVERRHLMNQWAHAIPIPYLHIINLRHNNWRLCLVFIKLNCLFVFLSFCLCPCDFIPSQHQLATIHWNWHLGDWVTGTVWNRPPFICNVRQSSFHPQKKTTMRDGLIDFWCLRLETMSGSKRKNRRHLGTLSLVVISF